MKAPNVIQIGMPQLPDKADLTNNREKYIADCDRYIEALLIVKEWCADTVRDLKISKLNS